MAASVIITINIAPEKLGKLRIVAMRAKARLRAVAPEEFGQKMGALAGLEPLDPAAAPGQAFDEEMIVMAGLSNAQMNTFLQDMRRFGAAPVQLKAVLTPTNAQWTPAQLHTELCAEREAFARGMQAHEPQA